MIVKLWCNVHRRPAEECDYKGGSMIPCHIIDCKEVGIEIEIERTDEEWAKEEELKKGREAHLKRLEEINKGRKTWIEWQKDKQRADWLKEELRLEQEEDRRKKSRR